MGYNVDNGIYECLFFSMLN